MKFVTSSATLSARLNTIGRVITQKNNIPILDCFCLEISGKTLTITASDNDTTISSKIELNECDENARFAVNAKILQDAIKEIPEQPLTFTLNTSTNELSIEYQNGQYQLMAQDATSYPIPDLDGKEQITLTINASNLLSGISRAMVASASDTLRAQLNTVCFDIKGQNLSVVATNGNQLALTQMYLGSTDAEGIFLLNTRPASLLKNVLTKEQGDVEAKFGERGAIFTTENYCMICSLVAGRYPNYRSVIPTNNPNIITIDRLSLISVLRRILVFANPSAVLVLFQMEASRLKISSQDNDFGKSAEETMLCDYSGMPLRVAFKGSTLLELIQSLEVDEIQMELSDPSRAGIIKPAKQKENEEVLMLIMPSVFND